MDGPHNSQMKAPERSVSKGTGKSLDTPPGGSSVLGETNKGARHSYPEEEMDGDYHANVTGCCSKPVMEGY